MKRPDPKHSPKYRENLTRYEAEGDEERARIQRALIKRMEAGK